MNRDKQIEEMANDLAKICPDLVENSCGQVNCVTHLTLSLSKMGYRKSTDVAREIFEEIEAEMEAAIDSNYRAKREHKNHSVIPNYDNFDAMCDGKIYAMRGLLDFIAELKKKYTEGEGCL